MKICLGIDHRGKSVFILESIATFQKTIVLYRYRESLSLGSRPKITVLSI